MNLRAIEGPGIAKPVGAYSQAIAYKGFIMVENYEKRMTLRDAREFVPGRPSYETVWRWARKGCRGVRLEYTRIGRTIYTSRESLERFFQRLTALDDDLSNTGETQSNNPGHVAAEEVLNKAGI